MNARSRLFVLAALALALFAAERSTTVAQRLGAPRAEIARVQPTRLSAKTRARLAALEDDLVLSYFASAPADAPPEYRALRDEVCELFEAMQAASKGRLRWELADPDSSPELAAYASLARARPLRVRTVERDTWRETRVWSSIAIAYGARPRATIAGVTPEARGLLQNWIVAQLDQLERPSRARVALIAPNEGFDELEAELALGADVTRMPPGDLQREGLQQADALFWVDPQAPDEDDARALFDWLDSGRPALLAGSAWRAQSGGTRASAGFESTGLEASGFLGLLGLEPLPGPVLDLRCESVGPAGDKLDLPWRVLSIAPDQDFRGLIGQPNGTIVFEAPTAFVPSAERLDELGFESTSLASASSEAWVQTPRAEQWSLEQLRPEAGAPTPRATLAARLSPVDPRRGDLIVLGSSSPLRDGELLREETAHAVLADVVSGHMTRPERLVTARMSTPRPELVPELSAGKRSLWRILCVALPPILFAGLALLRRRSSRSALGSASPRLLGAGLGALAIALLIASLAGALSTRAGLRADLTRDGLHRASDATRALGARLEAPLQVELAFSGDLPGELDAIEARLLELLRDLQLERGSGLELERLDPERASEEELFELSQRGIRALPITSKGADSTRGRRVFASARLSVSGRSEVLDFESAASLESLELRLAIALGRLAGDPCARGRVVLMADTPRLSPAEAHMEYQTRGLFAPTGADVYALSRRALERAGFEVIPRSPGAPGPIGDTDLVIWLQPRRSIEAGLDALVEHLTQGGRAIVAAQHFNVRSRQLADQGFRTVHWPDPQFPDIDQAYLPSLGVQLVREVLCDRAPAPLELPAEVQRVGEGRDFVLQESTLPVQLRALSSRFAQDQPLMRGLGDQLFLWGNRFTLDQDRLSAAGLRATPLITTSPRAWAIDWSGGNLDPADLDGTGPATRPVENGVLALLLEGRFPDRDGIPGSNPGALALLGSSESLKNPHLAGEEFRADQLLINLAAGLGLGEQYGAVATRRVVAAGFEPPSPAKRAGLRLWSVGAFPGLLAILALVWRAMRGRSPSALARGAKL